VQGATAVVSLLIGAGASFAVSEVGDRWRSRRERTRHWEDRRVEAYIQFSTATKSMMALLFRLAATLGNDDQTERMEYDAQAKLALAEAFMIRESAFEVIRLIGDPKLFEAARDWVKRVYDMRIMVDAQTVDRRRWHGLVASANAARDEFHRVARADLQSMTGGAQPY
jgi:hypothetical protein